MPNRIIKESINDSRGLNSCTVFAQDLFKRLITYADDYGRFNADTEIMMARLYPRDVGIVSQEDIVCGLIELCGIGKIQFYTTKIFDTHGAKNVYGVFPRWKEHQRTRESKAKCPEPGDTDINDWYLRRFVPIDLKAEIIERDGFKCQICGKFLTTSKEAKRFVKLATGLYHIDHIVPVSQGGRATLENLRLTCPDCNLKRKRKFTFDEILAETRRNSPQLAATCRNLRPESNPIRIQSESESESEAEPAREPTAVVCDAEKPDFDTLEAYASSNLTVLSPRNMEELLAFREDLDEDVIRHAIDEACAAGRRNWSYARAILRRFLESDLKTMGDVKAAESRRAANGNNAAAKGFQQHSYSDKDFGSGFFYDPAADYGK